MLATRDFSLISVTWRDSLNIPDHSDTSTPRTSSKCQHYLDLFLTCPVRAYHPLPVETSHPGVLRLTGGPHENCQTVKTALLAMTPVMGLLRDTTEGVKTGLLAAVSHYVCQKLETPLRFTFACCEGEETSIGCRESHPCCRRSPGSEGCLHQFPCCGGGPGSPGCVRSYPCCGRPEGVAGCEQVCKRCELPWGQPAGVCFRRPHTLISLDL